jgi:hypothetical protein
MKTIIYHTTLAGHWKKPHLICECNGKAIDLATLNVSPEDLYKYLGEALDIKFVDKPDSDYL